MQEALFVEFVGTFVFISVIFRYASKEWGALAIATALAAVILFAGYASGGHFNPAVSLAMYVANNIPLTKLAWRILCLHAQRQTASTICGVIASSHV